MIWRWLIIALSAFVVNTDNPPDLLQLATAQGIRQNNGSDHVFLYTFARQGQSRETLVLLPGAVFQTGVIRSGAQRCISLQAAMPFNLGDGAVLKISLADERRRVQAVQLSLDPAHIRAHRAWTPIRLVIPTDMDHFTLQFEVDAGARGDSTADWVGIAAGSEAGCLLADSNGRR